MDYEKLYKEALERARELNNKLEKNCSLATPTAIESIFLELKESEDERIREAIRKHIVGYDPNNEILIKEEGVSEKQMLAWLEKQGKQSEQKEINLVKILKHYPIETELYSPLYGKLWLAEVDEECKIITCYKHPLDKGCTRAILKQEDTVSFYSNGTTGLPDFSISKDCMLFLYNIEKQGEQKPAWSNGDDEMILDTIRAFQLAYPYATEEENPRRRNIDWLKSLKDRLQPHWKPTEEQIEDLEYAINMVDKCCEDSLQSLYNDLKKL